MEYTAFNHNAWNPLHSIGMHFTRLHGIHCIQSRCMESTAFNQAALYHAAWIPLISITMPGIHCIQSGCFGQCCFKSTALIGMHWASLHDSTAYNQDPLRLNALNPLHSMTLHGIHCIQSGCFGPCCIKSTAFHRDALGLAAWTPLHTIRIHCASMH